MSREEIKSRESPSAASKSKANGTERKASTDEVLAALAEEAAAGPASSGTTVFRALRDVALVAALLGGGTVLYYNHVKTKEAVAKLANVAADRLQKDDLASLKEAEAKYTEILALDKSNATGLSGLADTYFRQYYHGLDTKGLTEETLRKAGNAETAERYAVGAYLKIANGAAGEAEQEMKALLDRNIYHSKLAHAYGWALMDEGRSTEANQTLSKALDTDFGGVRIALTLAENAHRNGDERAAAKQLDRILGNAMNPQHEIALVWLAALKAKNSGRLDGPLKWVQAVAEKEKAGKDSIGPLARAHLAWAAGELAMAVGNNEAALKKADEAISMKKDFAPYYDLKARALAATGKVKDAYANYEAGMALKPPFRGLKMELAKLKSENKDDGALPLIDDLEKSDKSAHGPDYEIFRGNHYVRQGKLDEAKAAFTRAADLGDDPNILFGLAKVTFLEEKKKGKKADLDKVGEAFQRALEARAIFPELHDYMAELNLWNFQVAAANKDFEDAEGQYKKLNRPVPELLKFYDRVIAMFDGAKDKEVQKDAVKLVPTWKKKKADYLASLGLGG